MIELLLGITIACIYIVILATYKNRKTSNLEKMFAFVFMSLLLQVLGSFLQVVFKEQINIPLVYYEYIIYIGKALLPTLLLIFAFLYDNPRVNIKKYTWLLFIPVFIIVSVWTNDFHNLFFVNYNVNNVNATYGILYYIYVGLTYLQIVPALVIIIRASIDKSGLSSPQTLLLVISIVIPFIPNFITLTSGKVLPSYITQVSYMFTALLVSYGIIKYNILNAVPIALKSVVNIMSDAFMVISPDGTMVDMNRSFVSKIGNNLNLKLNKNIYETIKYEGLKDLKNLKSQVLEAEDKGKEITEEYHIVSKDINKYYEIQAQPIKAKTSKGYIATLLVFRDITEARDNLDIIIKSENLSVIGELAGGVAHEINTPITAIKSGLLMLRNTVKTKEERELIESMTNSADKIAGLANSLRNQIRNLGSNSNTEFSLTELLQDLYVIMHSEFVKNNIKIDINTTEDIWVSGNTSKLAQVITNIIHNSMDAYKGKGGIIDINVYRDENENNVISIEDWAGGISEEVRPYIFKKLVKVNDMPTTGVGLYLAYSVIKGSFGGNIKFDTKTGRGTKFYIILPNR